MKKIFTLICTLCATLTLFAQQNLNNLVGGENGTSQHFVRLLPAQQPTFNPGELRSLLSLPATSQLAVQEFEKDRQGILHYRYYQTFNGIAIENAMYVAHVQNGKLVALSGEILTDFDSELPARHKIRLTAAQAINKAVSLVNAKIYAWQDPDMELSLKQQRNNTRATYYPTANLVWYNGNDGLNSRELQLAYKVDVYARQPLSRAYYFISAATGEFLGKKDELYFEDYTGIAKTAYSGDQLIHSNLNSTTYQLRDLTKGAGILTLHGESGKRGTNYTSTTANWQLAGTDQAALDAHYGVAATYSYYLENFNRNSYDNKGTALTSYVNDPTYTDNAFWDGSAMNFNKRSNSTANPGGVTGIDVTGHELTHGVTQNTSNLNYSKEPGAINESMSDIHGKSVQFYTKPNDVNWLMSNDMNWIIRDMQNPKSQGQPDTYKGINWVTTSGDNYGVHTNSGVGNKMFYLLVVGGTGTNDLNNYYDVTGIGLAKADQIIYRTNAYYLTPTSQYIDWRQACVNAALDLYPGDQTILAAVQNAWYAVGVGPSANGSSCETPYNLAASSITTASANLTWNSAAATSYNLQWKASSASVWNTISGIGSNTYSLSGLSANTKYDFKVVADCSSSSSTYSATTSFTTLATGAVTYCTSSGTSNYEYIKKVVLGSINNQSNNNGGYANYTNLSTNLTTNSTYSISLTPGFSSTKYNEAWTVYIDYNHDGDFADAGELVATGSGKAAISRSFKVPATIVNGATRMRIQMIYGTSSLTNSCAQYKYGEVEDYTVVLSGASTFSNFMVNTNEPLLKIAPNPVTEAGTSVTYRVAESGKVVLTLCDLTGKTIETYSPGYKVAGYYQFFLDRSKSMRPGAYLLTVYQNNKQISRTTLVAGK